MLDRVQLRQYHRQDLPLHILEQDYVQALFLTELYRDVEHLIFKGGTFLKHAHGLDRFSEDLDFTTRADEDIPEVLSGAAHTVSRYGLSAEIDQATQQPHGVVARLRYRGPLYDGSDRSQGSIELEVSTRDDLVRTPEWRRLFFPYPETRAVTAHCLSIEEAFAEKLRALSTRVRGRDLYDCWFLLQQEVHIEPAVFAAKMAVLDKPARVTISITDAEWDRDLAVLLEHPPSYQTVLEDVTDALRAVDIPVDLDRE